MGKPYTLKDRLRRSYYWMQGGYPCSIGGHDFVLDAEHSRFWRNAARGRWEPETYKVIKQNLGPDSDYVDIGAWIGPTVTYGARCARHVYAFEPDPVALKFLNWNVQKNGMTNVDVFGMAVAPRDGAFDIAPGEGELGASGTSLLWSDRPNTVKCWGVSWPSFVSEVDLDRVGLIKIDVEGAEFDLLPTMAADLKSRNTALFLSIHVPFLDASDRREQMTALVEALSFYPVVHNEALERIDAATMIEEGVDKGLTSFLLSRQ